ncbi:MAG: substrate-binding domain-containing protein, partial [Planctomycetota bacterium]
MNLLSLRRSFVIFCAAATLMLGTSPNADAQKNQLRGSVRIDGSSTVFPISEAASSFFAKYYPDVKITLGQSGTGGGFKRFVKGETDISDASRPIKPSEYKATVDNKVEFIEMPIAYDGLTIVVPPESTFVDKLTVDELKKIFLADSAAKTWSEVRAGWPAQPIKIFAPGER